jgi:hypothetical protein
LFARGVAWWERGSGVAALGSKFGAKMNILNKKLDLCTKKMLNYSAEYNQIQ